MNEPLSQIPPLGGLCSYEEASRTTLSVEGCVEWLKRLHYVFRRLHQIFTSHITAEPIYELKTAFSLHAHLCAEHAQAIRTRVSEIRETGRNAQGVKLIDTREGEMLSGIAPVVANEEEDEAEPSAPE